MSYLGWIPKARILPTASQQPAWRNLMMIAHLVWGSVMALFLRRWGQTRYRPGYARSNGPDLFSADRGA